VPAHPDAATEVQRFYDRYPYPRPVGDLARYRLLWQDPERRRAEFHLYWPHRPYRDDFSILIAGCGTSQAAKYALRWPRAKVTAIDFSATSVRCTEELKRRYSLHNLDVRSLCVEQVAELGMRFDQIICTGVLHHLPDPDAGLNALRASLESDGAMHLMVYAPYGRAGIYLLQEFCRRLGIGANEQDIVELIGALKSLPAGHPLGNLLRDAPDFREEAALADALLNPQDRAYSVPQLFDWIQTAGLTFHRWVRQAPYSAQCGIMNRIPQSSRLLRLPLTEQYAAVELFRGTLVRHSLIVGRTDGTAVPGQISFAGDAWRSFVPIRRPDTICVREKLPAGAAAVLINRTHTYTDLYLPIGAQQKRQFDAIDGQRCIGALAMGSDSLDAVRVFFERLWLMDQIVFDASATNPRAV
jgi:SAM-dependent methyltransferase